MQTPLEFAVQYRAGYFTAYHTVIQEAATDTARYPDNGILGHILFVISRNTANIPIIMKTTKICVA